MTAKPATKTQDVPVVVFFDPTAPDPTITWKFKPEDAVMKYPGNVNFARDPKCVAWEFEDAKVKSDVEKQFNVDANGGNLMIKNAHTTKGSWDYKVYVEYKGKHYESPDPKIINTDPVKDG